MTIPESADWQAVAEYGDITYHKADGMARIAFDRPEKRNAFRPKHRSDDRCVQRCLGR